MDADGSNVRQLSDVVGSDWAFVRVDWSHDGTKIVGQAGAADDIYELGHLGDQRRRQRRNQRWARIRRGSTRSFPVGHPTGMRWRGRRDGIVLMEEGAEPVDLPGPDGVPVWSADGQLLATTADSIVVMDLDGTVQMTVAGPASDLTWQPLFE